MPDSLRLLLLVSAVGLIILTYLPASPGGQLAATHVHQGAARVERRLAAQTHTPRGRHITLDFHRVPQHLLAKLDDVASLQTRIAALIQQAHMTLLGQSCHAFEPHGVTCVWLLSESHLSLHTWPEHQYAALDIFTCGALARPEVLVDGLRQLRQPGLVVAEEHDRGTLDPATLSPQQLEARELHTFGESTSTNLGFRPMFYRVPILHERRTRYQRVQVVEVGGDLGRCLLLDGVVQFCSHDLDGYTNHMAREPLRLLQQLRQQAQLPCSAAGTSSSPARGGGRANSSAVGHDDARASAVPAHPKFEPAARHARPYYITCDAAEFAQPSPGSCAEQHAPPARVLLIGGGDGWIAGHLVGCYGAVVHSVDVVELDKAVSEVTATFFRTPSTSPFDHPRIHWHYTDAFAWVTGQAHGCLKNESVSGCARYDAVIIDSTDHTHDAASNLFTRAFYAALIKLVAPRAALIQQFNVYERAFEPSLQAVQAALVQAGWSDTFRSLVYTPAYTGQTVFVHATRRATPAVATARR